MWKELMLFEYQLTKECLIFDMMGIATSTLIVSFTNLNL